MRISEKDITIELYNEASQLVIAYRVCRSRVPEYVSLPELDACADTVAIEMIKPGNEGWERDEEVTEPEEPEFGGR